jgi:hypothetical protein
MFIVKLYYIFSYLPEVVHVLQITMHYKNPPGQLKTASLNQLKHLHPAVIRVRNKNLPGTVDTNL